MTDWIKIDAEHMPPDMEPIIVTGIDNKGLKYVDYTCRWNNKFNSWEWCSEPVAFQWEKICNKITHWMPYPDPAQD